MKVLSLKESQSRLLDLAIVVRDIANRHNIPFFMVGGTMLGAIRHKGFIPWDDDMDFGVTYDHFFELIKILKTELPSNYRCLCYEDNSPVHSFFFKVEDSNTIIDDPCLAMPLEEKLGLSIDVFPIVSCNEKEGRVVSNKIRKIWVKERRRKIPQDAPVGVKIAKRILSLFDFGNYVKRNRLIKQILDNVSNGDRYCNIVSPQFWAILWPKNTFDDLESYLFEEYSFRGPKDYDSYLSKCYRDYMTLPPKEKRRVHGGNVYLR